MSELLPYTLLNEQLITQFRAKFTCLYCGKQNILKDFTKPFKVIPLLSPPVDSRAVSAGLLLTKFLNKKFQAKCPAPCHGDNEARYHAVKGKFTFIGINRRGFYDTDGNVIPKLATRVTDTASGKWGDTYLGELVSVISHRGSINSGHFITYSKVTDGGGSWYLNDDCKRIKQTTHPLKNSKKGETAELLIFKNF